MAATTSSEWEYHADKFIEMADVYEKVGQLATRNRMLDRGERALRWPTSCERRTSNRSEHYESVPP